MSEYKVKEKLMYCKIVFNLYFLKVICIIILFNTRYELRSLRPRPLSHGTKFSNFFPCDTNKAPLISTRT